MSESEVKNTEETTATNDPMNNEDVQMAAGYYAQLCKTIKGYSSVMNGKGLARVMVALAEFPYGDNYPKFRSDAEQKLFTFMLTIQSAKAKIAEAIKNDMADIQNAAVDGIVKETVQSMNTKGEENGSKME